MKLHYMGKYDLNPESIPAKPHKPNYVMFKEAENAKALNTITASIASVLAVALLLPLFLNDFRAALDVFGKGALISLLTMFPHEILHAICFKEDVYLFTNLKHVQLFVAGPEDMSKGRFIFMSLLPNIVFGIIPYLIYLLNPNLAILGAVGAFNIASGAGDYLNVFNAITQMPKGSRTYMHHYNSCWYMPEK